MVQTTVIEKPFIDSGANLSEGVTYDARNHSLLWIDINRGWVYRTFLDDDDEPGEIASFKVDTYVGVLGLTEDTDKVLVGAAKAVLVLDLTSGKTSTLVEYLNGNLAENGWQLRSNDGCVDAAGNFWVGTMCDASCPKVDDLGTLFRLNKDSLKLEVVLEHVGIPNGIQWYNGSMFWTSSLEHIIYKFAVKSDGLPDVSTKTPFVEIPKVFATYENKALVKGEPDGFCMDAEGSIYTAVWGTNRVVKVNAAGEFVEEFVLPAKRISCTTIGGKNMDVLFITSGKNDEPDAAADDQGGKIFKVKIGTKGVAKNIWKGQL